MRGKPHVDVFEAQVVAHLQEDDPRDRVELGRKFRFALQTDRLAHRQVDREIHLAGLHRRHARRWVLDDLHGDATDRRLRSPVVVVALQHDAPVHFPFHQPIRAGADRLLREGLRTDLFDVAFGHHIAAEERQPHRRGRRGRAEMHHRLGGRQNLDVLHLAPGIGDIEARRGLDAVEEGEPEVIRRHLVAVVELHVVAQFHRHGQAVRRQLPARDQMRDQLEARVLVERLVEHRLEQRLRIGRETLVGVPTRHVTRPGDRHRIICRAHDRGCGERRGGQCEKAAA